jgi:hypothetical protein
MPIAYQGRAIPLDIDERLKPGSHCYKSLFDFSFNGYLCRMSFEQAKREFANGGEVESGVFLSRLAKVFAHDVVEHPVQVVLNAPMARVAARMAAATGSRDVM